ncbi:MAPEG family protein [uncultured Paraglaciecola sp.]|uniref:MAPEG family protein n=1 Tax=uncultured Paraglaciecola sp. TaxID=1765024 RepID=UPI00260B3EF9|nr:MAPEG family protein [uncultured Paraglaciecola sp.]
MSILLICLFIATVMPILAKAPLAMAQNKQQGGYDNRNPREQQAALSGFGARAKAAHENCFEALVMFVPGLMAVIATGNTGQTPQTLAITFVVARLLYLGAYYVDQHVIRTLFWFVGFVSSLALIWIAIP